MLANLTQDDSIADDKDTVGGSLGPLESGLYDCVISMAHINKSAGGALGLVLTLKSPDNREVRQTLWMTSGTAKGCKNYYEKDGEKHYLPGFNLANAVCQLAAGKDVSKMDTESKVISLYSYDAKAEVPTKVDVLMELLGKPIIVGLLKQIVDKTKKNDVTGVFEATGETREENEIDKVFRSDDRLTQAEIKARAVEAVFINTWETKWAGQTRNKAKGAAAGGTPGTPRLGGAPAPAASKKPVVSLFA